jgi:uncharacterized protein (UPF0332 family)/predicted nucleotidyltransferase
MPATLTADVRDALRDRFRAAFGDRLHRLVLYGSYARGEATPESDIDVLVVLEGEINSEDRDRSHEVMHHFTEEHGRNVSPLLTSRERFETYNEPLYRNVREEGKLLIPERDPEATASFHQHTYPINRSSRGMKEATEDGLNRARRSLESARAVLEDADTPNMAISSAYYAMLYAARAALNEAGKAPKSHQGVQHELRETYVRTGRLDARYHSMLSQAEGDRLDADYELSPSFTEADAKEWIAKAEDFVDTLEILLSENAAESNGAPDESDAS